MIVSWNWLRDYVDLNMSRDELVDRLTMSGLNCDGLEYVGNDVAINLEVTSNRPDCLGHIGIAREIAVLFDLRLKRPEPAPAAVAERVEDRCQARIDCPDLCYRYTARLIRGARISTSPKWLVDRLATIGIASINNVVDATNYVMFECGQPLHAFDFARVKDGQIVVRESKANEEIRAIDHRSYRLQPGMCVIADTANPLAIGGVMGGADSEIGAATTEILIEAAYFNQMTIRSAARALNLHSPSSFRFERDVDPAQIDWASKRCCELILQTGGGQLLGGMIDVGQRPVTTAPIRLRLSQVERILGIRIPDEFVSKTLGGLGATVDSSGKDVFAVYAVVAPSWRKDLTREIDLVEEVGRIYGYEHVPDNANVPMAASYQIKADRVLDKVRGVLTAAGFDEAVTPSLVPQPWSDAFSPWSDATPLISSQPMQGVLEKASQNIGAVEYVRRSLIPSLLEARRINEYRSNPRIEIFETAKIYLSATAGELPHQPMLAAVCSGRGFFELKGVVEVLLDRMASGTRMRLAPFDHPLLDVNESGMMLLGDRIFGFIGSISEPGRKIFGLRNPAAVAEFDLQLLEDIAILIARHENQSQFPSVTRDFNLVMPDDVRWSDVEDSVRAASDSFLESVQYRETFRNQAKDGPGRKRVLLSVTFRSAEETMTGEQAEQLSQRIVADCKRKHGAELLA